MLIAQELDGLKAAPKPSREEGEKQGLRKAGERLAHYERKRVVVLSKTGKKVLRPP